MRHQGKVTYLASHQRDCDNDAADLALEQRLHTETHPSAINTRADFYRVIARITDLQCLIDEEEKRINDYFEWSRNEKEKHEPN